MSSVRRVLMSTDTVGGVWTYALELSRALARRGVEVALAAMGAPLNGDQRREASDFTVFEGAYRLEWMDEPWEDVAAAGRWLRDLEAYWHPDVVHLNGYAHAALPFEAPVLAVAHSCVPSWWRAVKRGEAPSEWDRYRREVGAGLCAAGRVIAPTRVMLDSVVRDYGPLRDTQVIPNGRGAEFFHVGRKEPLLFAAGRLWDDAKNVGLLETVAPRLPWPAYVAGDNCRPDADVRQSRLHMLGRLSSGEVAQWMARASIYVLPARYEPFGLSALEAALSGCALVLGDIASLHEVWGEAAMYVEPDDAAGLEATLRCLIADTNLRNRMADRARRRALLYTPERMCDGYMAAYETLAARRDK